MLFKKKGDEAPPKPKRSKKAMAEDSKVSDAAFAFRVGPGGSSRDDYKTGKAADAEEDADEDDLFGSEPDEGEEGGDEDLADIKRIAEEHGDSLSDEAAQAICDHFKSSAM